MHKLISKLMKILTHALELFFELRLVLALCDAEIIVRVGTLVHAVWRGCSADCQDRGRAFCTLCVADLLNSHHLLLSKVATKKQ